MSDRPLKPNAEKQDRQDKGVKRLHRLPLKKAIELARAVFELGENDPVPKAVALDHIGRAAKGGASATLAGAATAYGLTKSVNERLQLTERGRKIVDPSIDAVTKQQAIFDALFASEIFSATVSRFADKTIIEKSVLLYLTQGLSLSDPDAQTFWEVTKSNLDDFGLTQVLSTGDKIIITREKAEAKLSSQKQSNTDTDKDAPTPTPLEPTLEVLADETSVSQARIYGNRGNAEFHFNIQIQLPESASPDVYDAIFKSIATHLLRKEED